MLQSARDVFPTCQHGAVGCGLIHAVPHSLIRKVYRYYLANEKRRALIDDEDAARQNLLGDMKDPLVHSGGFYPHPPSEEDEKPCNQRLQSRATALIPPSGGIEEANSAVFSGRKLSITFADSVGEILRTKLSNSESKTNGDIHHRFDGQSHEFGVTRTLEASRQQELLKPVLMQGYSGITVLKDGSHQEQNELNSSAVVKPLTIENVQRYLSCGRTESDSSNQGNLGYLFPSVNLGPVKLENDDSIMPMKCCETRLAPKLRVKTGVTGLDAWSMAFIGPDSLKKGEVDDFMRPNIRDNSEGCSVSRYSSVQSILNEENGQNGDENQLYGNRQGIITELALEQNYVSHLNHSTLVNEHNDSINSLDNGRAAWDSATAWRLMYRKILGYDDPTLLIMSNQETEPDLGIGDRGDCKGKLSQSNRLSTGKSSGRAGATRSRYDSSWLTRSSAGRRDANGSSRSLTIAAVETAAMVASSGLRKLQSVLKPSVDRAQVSTQINQFTSKDRDVQYEAALKEEEIEDNFTRHVILATIQDMKWYFRSEFHSASLILVSQQMNLDCDSNNKSPIFQ